MEKIKKFETTQNVYTYVEQIGSGGSGVVVKVEDEENNIFALKYLNPANMTNNKRKRFINEIKFCFEKKHPNIIGVIEHGFIFLENNKCPFYVMPLYDKTLRNLIDESKNPEEYWAYFIQILEGIKEAHKNNIIHRDLKPENILYSTSQKKLVIADFGIAHFEEEWLQTCVETKQSERLANFQYAAPEQRERTRNIDYRADIYSLGLILNEMYTKQIPLGSNYKKIGEVFEDYKFLDDIVEKMLNANPTKRPTSIEEIQKELLARKNIYLSQTKQRELQEIKIKPGQPDDLIYNNPIEIKDIDYNPEVESLQIFLNNAPNKLWIEECFKNLDSYQGNSFIYPNRFIFDYNKRVAITVRAQDVQPAIDYFKSYIAKANDKYKQKIEEIIKRKEQIELEEIKNKIKAEEIKQRVLANIKF